MNKVTCITLLFFICSIYAFKAQSQADEKNLVFTHSVENLKASKDEMYRKIITALSSLLKPIDSFTLTQDQPKGLIILKPFYQIMTPTKPGKYMPSEKIMYNVRIDLNDSSYKVKVSDFIHQGIEAAASGGMMSQEFPSCDTLKLPMKKWWQLQNLSKSIAISLIEFLDSAAKQN